MIRRKDENHYRYAISEVSSEVVEAVGVPL
ncbi:hypothetical protein IL54_1573 [Sphingobium sp. ba1]|nr:hypothetical protein IL54_1573 [Sphingobium sp. ba1]